MLETIGAVDKFVRAVQLIPGMEWLGEIEEEDLPPDDDFFAEDKDGRRKSGDMLRGRLFLIFSNKEALQNLLSLWKRWKAGKRLDQGLNRWGNVFDKLYDVRAWSVQDRLQETGVVEDWRDRVAHDQDAVPCEIELWFRREPQVRHNAQERVERLVKDLQGEVLGQSVIPEVAYHALLVRLPASAVEQITASATPDIALLQCENVQFFRATGQMAGVVADGDRSPDDRAISGPAVPAGPPVVALFDGMPLQNHRRLAGRLIVDDPDGLEAAYQVHERRHGTAMASLIIHGELDAGEQALARPLYVRPVFRPDPSDWRTPRSEAVDENTLVVDLLHRAIRRLFEAQGSVPPVAESVCVVNLSIGLRDRPFQTTLSPLARLIDWLSWRYRVLFVVSAGNHSHPIRLGVSGAALRSLPPDQVQEHVLRSVAADAKLRRLLSPAEATNALTVGALHKDSSSVNEVPRTLDPFVDGDLPSLINAQGMGYRRAIKPDILHPGGRVVLHEPLLMNSNAELAVYTGTLRPGQRAAAPGATPGDNAASWCVRGTSNSAALTSRTAAKLYDVLQSLRDEPGGSLIEAVPYALWLKTLLVHSAGWGSAEITLERILKTPANKGEFREYLTRLLGYGVMAPERAAECTAHRATALGGGTLTADRAHVHRFPLPPSLSGKRGLRRLIVTLAWFTPVNPQHQAWRRADLWFSPGSNPLKVERQQADWQAARRGTLQHEVFEGEKAVAFVDGDVCEIHVNCRADAGSLEDDVPYALAITLEVDERIGVQIYDEIRTKVYAAIQVNPTP